MCRSAGIHATCTAASWILSLTAATASTRPSDWRPEATSADSGASGEACDQSCPQAKKRSIALSTHSPRSM
jgi:hypothetical protein